MDGTCCPLGQVWVSFVLLQKLCLGTDKEPNPISSWSHQGSCSTVQRAPGLCRQHPSRCQVIDSSPQKCKKCTGNQGWPEEF